MQNQLIHKTATKIAVNYSRLSIVRNPDRFLAMDDVCRTLNQEEGLTIINGSNLHLRLHFETVFKQDSKGRYVYVCNNVESLVPDMTEGAFMTEFSISDAFPLFADKSLLKGVELDALSVLFNRCGIRKISMAEGKYLLQDINRELAQKRETSAEHYRQCIQELDVDWANAADYSIENISRCMVDAIRNGVYDAIVPQIESFNKQFQSWIDQAYFATLNSNPVLKPKAVNKILPHIAENIDNDSKVALVVVDGLSYWQYYVLKRHLALQSIQTKDSTTLAWIPSITMLSRQAIFRGDTPKQEYKQSPVNEKKLWFDFWKNNGISGYAIQYLSDKDEFAINETTRRLAYVTVEMDEKMHSSTDYKDLLALTENWCPRITEKIKTLKQMGFAIYLTTDHGSILSCGWQPISQVEKVFLYKDGSRGKRHLMYIEREQKEAFANKHRDDIEMLSHDNWLSIRSDACFDCEGKQIITHGGSHFMEVLIPFITIK